MQLLPLIKPGLRRFRTCSANIAATMMTTTTKNTMSAMNPFVLLLSPCPLPPVLWYKECNRLPPVPPLGAPDLLTCAAFLLLLFFVRDNSLDNKAIHATCNCHFSKEVMGTFWVL